jgi:FkbM family methyltransferase
VDLGANIGMTSLWLASRYDIKEVFCVEPDKSNCEVLRKNLTANKIPHQILESAVGSADGTARFRSNDASNLGRIDKEGSEVPLISMETILSRKLDGNMIDLLKIDIEGGEQELLSNGDLGWLRSVREIIIEFHPDCVDYPGLTSLLQKAGFKYSASNELFPGSMDYFIRTAQ